jgi:outer membrane protein TolC
MRSCGAAVLVGALTATSCYAPQALPSRPFDSVPTVAQPLPSPAGAVSEDELVRIALSRSDEVRSLESLADESALRVDGAGDLRNPELRGGRISDRYLDRQQYELELGVRWRPPVPGQLSATRDVARAEVLRRTAEVASRRLELAALVRRTAANMRARSAQVEIGARQVDLERRAVVLAEALLSIGETTRVDLGRAQLRLRRAQAGLEDAENDLERSRRLVARLVGAPPPNDIERPASMGLDEGQPTPPPMPQELAGAYLDAQAKLHLEQLEPWPQLSFVEVSYHLEPVDTDNFFELRFGVEIPIFDANGPEIRAAKLAVERTKARFEFESQRRRSEIEDAEDDLRRARAALERDSRETAALRSETSGWSQRDDGQASDTLETLALERDLLDAEERTSRLSEQVDLAEVALRLARALE